MVEDVGQPRRGGLVERAALANVKLRGLEQVAVAAELELACGRVSPPHGPGAPVAVELELLVARGRVTVEVVEDVQVGLGALDRT